MRLAAAYCTAQLWSSVLLPSCSWCFLPFYLYVNYFFQHLQVSNSLSPRALSQMCPFLWTILVFAGVILPLSDANTETGTVWTALIPHPVKLCMFYGWRTRASGQQACPGGQVVGRGVGVRVGGSSAVQCPSLLCILPWTITRWFCVLWS